MISTAITHDDLVIGEGDYRDELVTVTLSAAAGSVEDTTAYPVVDQSTKTEKVTVDGGAEQTVTFTTAIKRGHAVAAADQFPLSTQNSLTEKVTLNGGSEQTVTFSGVLTTAAHIAAAMDAQLSGCKVVVEDGAVHIYCDTPGATSAVVIGTGTTDLVWASPAAINTAEDIAKEMNDQLTGCEVAVSSGQVKITSDSTGAGSSVSIGTGTAGLTWDTAVDGTANTGALLKGTLLARNSSTTKLVPYVSGGGNATGTPIAVLPAAETWTTTGDKRLRCLFGGRVIQENLVAHDVAGAVPIAAIQTLISNSTIVPVQSSATGA